MEAVSLSAAPPRMAMTNSPVKNANALTDGTPNFEAIEASPACTQKRLDGTLLDAMSRDENGFSNFSVIPATLWLLMHHTFVSRR